MRPTGAPRALRLPVGPRNPHGGRPRAGRRADRCRRGLPGRPRVGRWVLAVPSPGTGAHPAPRPPARPRRAAGRGRVRRARVPRPVRVGHGRLPRGVDVLHPVGVPDHLAAAAGVGPVGQSSDLRRFWGRRFRRLLPASWFTLALVVAMGAVGIWVTDQLRSLRGDVPFALAEIINWHFIGRAAPTAPRSPPRRPSSTSGAWRSSSSSTCAAVAAGRHAGPGVPGGRPGPAAVVARGCAGCGSAAVGAMARWGRCGATSAPGGLGRPASSCSTGAPCNLPRSYFGTETRLAELVAGAVLACVCCGASGPGPVGPPPGWWALRWWACAVILVLWTRGHGGLGWMYPWGFLLTAACTSPSSPGRCKGGGPPGRSVARHRSWPRPDQLRRVPAALAGVPVAHPGTDRVVALAAVRPAHGRDAGRGQSDVPPPGDPIRTGAPPPAPPGRSRGRPPRWSCSWSPPCW